MMADDDSRYRVTRRTREGLSRDTLRDVVPPTEMAAPTEAELELDLELATPSKPPKPIMAVGSQGGIARVNATEVPDPTAKRVQDPPAVPLYVEKRSFGGYEIVIQHRGNEVTFILPGALRLVGTHDEAMALVRALIGRRK